MSKRTYLVLVLLLAMSLAGCKRGSILNKDYLYVAAPQVQLRDRVAAVYNKAGIARNGERLEVLERQKRFARVRTPRGEEGWVELRNLAEEDVFDGFQKLTKDNKDTPVQGRGATRASLNMHLTPARDGERLYQLAEGEKVEVLKRSTAIRLTAQEIAAKQAAANRQAYLEKKAAEAADRAEKLARKQEKTKKKSKGPEIPPPQTAPDPPDDWDTKTDPEVYADLKLAQNPHLAAASVSAITGKPDAPKEKPYDDWWLVRNKEGKAGWVLARMIDLEVPLEVAQYAEGQRIMGAYVLNKVEDSEKGQVSQYLVVLNEPKDGTPFDFNQIRVFSWNRARHRYETAYRERNIVGYFPVKTGTEDFGKDGVLPVFAVRKQNEDGTITDRKYRMIGPIVRQITLPGEEQKKAAQAVVKKPGDDQHKGRKRANRR